MPARRKKLPHPCPICGSPYGTVQVVFLSGMRRTKEQSRYDAWNERVKPKLRSNGGSGEARFKIGHYDAEAYRKAKELVKNLNISEGEKEKIIRKEQRKWCTFNSSILYEKNFKQEFGSSTATMTFTDFIRDEVLDRGWENL